MMTVAQAAAAWNVNRRTILKWINGKDSSGRGKRMTEGVDYTREGSEDGPIYMVLRTTPPPPSIAPIPFAEREKRGPRVSGEAKTRYEQDEEQEEPEVPPEPEPEPEPVAPKPRKKRAQKAEETRYEAEQEQEVATPPPEPERAPEPVKVPKVRKAREKKQPEGLLPSQKKQPAPKPEPKPKKAAAPKKAPAPEPVPEPAEPEVTPEEAAAKFPAHLELFGWIATVSPDPSLNGLVRYMAEKLSEFYGGASMAQIVQTVPLKAIEDAMTEILKPSGLGRKATYMALVVCLLAFRKLYFLDLVGTRYPAGAIDLSVLRQPARVAGLAGIFDDETLSIWER
jgi:hypothetical protein